MSLGRRAGLLLPLSAVRSRSDLGLGDAAALVPLFDWMRSAGLTVLQVLPLHDLGPEDSCPYASLSASALDWGYLDLSAVPGLSADPELRSACAAKLRGEPRARFASARAFKRRLLERAFPGEERSRDFADFRERESYWLEDYTLFRALKEESAWKPWREWPESLRAREPGALSEARRRLERPIAFHRWLQWLMDSQWRSVRAAAAERGVLLYGDIPFGVSAESADVWAHPEGFDLGVSMGAPPDQYSPTGQDWELPAYRWDAMEAGGLRWWRARVKRSAEFFDVLRLDHAVGFFRTWRVPKDGSARGFDVADDSAARARGERFFRMAREEARGGELVAEDLGVIPPFVREVLGALSVPGYKITRWERYGDGFADPRYNPPRSVAAIGNHDTSPLASWWEEIPEWDRARYWKMASGEEWAPPFSERVRERVIANLYASGSDLVVPCFQDIEGSRERINVPGTVGEHNWTWRMPCAAEDLDAGTAAWLKRLAMDSGRKTC